MDQARPDEAGHAPSGAARLVGLLGWPVAHSLSPRLHRAVHVERGIDALYAPFPVAPADLAVAVRGLVAAGLHGANVTVPHKRAVMDLCDDVTDEARLVGAVNTLVVDGRAITGDNTDARGLAAALAHDVGDLDGVDAVVVGAGGAARAAVVALRRAGAHVVLAARRPDVARTVADELAAAVGPVDVADLADPGLPARVGAAAVVVNATPLGLHDEQLPDAVRGLGTGQVAYDLLYRATPWQAEAVATGATAHDGLRMLVEQAALSHVAWFGGEPPVAIMLTAVGA